MLVSRYILSGCRTRMSGRCNGDRMSTLHRAAYGKKTYTGYLETLISVQQEYKILHIHSSIAYVLTLTTNSN